MNRYNQANIEKPKLPLNDKLQGSLNNMVGDYATRTGKTTPCSVYNLSADEITYLQAFLEQVKVKKINQQAVQPNTKKCTSIGDGKPITECRVSSNIPNTRNTASTHSVHGAHGTHGTHGASNRMTEIYNPNFEENTVYGNRGGMATRSGRKGASGDAPSESFKPCLDSNAYYNPYEVGARQNEFGSLYKPTYTGPYNVKPDLLADIGMDNRMYWEKFPGDVRNVNVESLLYQGEMTHIPGQKEVTETEMNRFELLPFDPQDTKHILWKDNMPRGGYPTRVDRLETL